MLQTEKLTLTHAAHELGQREPSLRFVGSMARAAHMGVVLDEYRPNGTKRDIDAFRLGSREKTLDIPDGTDLDLYFENWIRPEANGTYLVLPHDERVAVEVPNAEEVFARHNVEINGTTVPTLHPEVLGAVGTMMYVERPKDKQPIRKYNAYLDSLGSSDRIDPALLQPFNVFSDQLSTHWKYLGRSYLRHGYQRVVPEKLRKKILVSEKMKSLRGPSR